MLRTDSDNYPFSDRGGSFSGGMKPFVTFSWFDIPEGVERLAARKKPVLYFVPELSIGLSSSDEAEHLLIEGENYLALTALRQEYTGEVDIIYIDPPYNTGTQAFLYHDSRFIELPENKEREGLHPSVRHSPWLSFMKKRLDVAYDLLRPDGCLLLSINEEELFNLKLLCDHVFGESNYITLFSVKVRHEDRILKGDKDIHEVVEYVLFYRKTLSYKPTKRDRLHDSSREYVYSIRENSAAPQRLRIGEKKVHLFRPGEFELRKGAAAEDKLKKINIRGSIKEGNSSGRFYMAHLASRKEGAGCLYKVYGIGADRYPYRYFLAPEGGKKRNGDYFQGMPVGSWRARKSPYPNLLDFESDFNFVGYEGGVEFRNGKKPVNFLKYLFTLATDKKEAVLLDYFAGSGSSGHAVLALNREQNRRIRCILVTNNENGIAEKVCYPRLKNAIQGYTYRSRQYPPLGGALRYCRIDFQDYPRSEINIGEK